MARNAIVFWVYALEIGGEVVYYGTTSAPKPQESSHRAEGKQFDKFTLLEKLRTPEEAHHWMRVYLSSYRRKNGGRHPKYNLSLVS